VTRLSRVNHTNQRKTGFSLVTVAALGAVTMMWLLAVSAAILPTYQRAASGRFQTLARNAAEAGLDYAVAELNAAIAANVISPIDDDTQDGRSKLSNVPNAAINNTSANVKIYVNNVAAPTWAASYNELKDSSNPSSPFFGQPNKWRTVFSVASYAGISRSIGVVLEPIAVATTNPTASTPTNTQTPVPYFKYAMFGRALMNMSANASTDGYDSRNGTYGGTNVLPTGGDVGTNGTVSVGGNSRVGGDLVVYSTPAGSATSQVANQSGNAIVNDQVIINGIDNNAFVGTPGATAQPGDNVLGMDRGSPPVPGYQPILESQSNPPIDYPAAPSAPAEAVNLGALSVSGNKTIQIPPGNYKVNSISVSGNGKILLVPDAQGNYGPVRFFVEGSSSGSNVIQLTGNSIINPSRSPSNLQLWYGGSKNVLVAGNSNFYGVIYAPGADVKITGNGTYFGSFVGNTVTDDGNGYVHFDKALSEKAAALGLTYLNSTTASAGTHTTLLFTGYRTISWHEF